MPYPLHSTYNDNADQRVYSVHRTGFSEKIVYATQNTSAVYWSILPAGYLVSKPHYYTYLEKWCRAGVKNAQNRTCFGHDVRPLVKYSIKNNIIIGENSVLSNRRSFTKYKTYNSVWIDANEHFRSSASL